MVPGLLTLHLDNYLCYEENENTGKKREILHKISNIFKTKAPIDKRGYRFGEEPCMYHYKKKLK